MITASRPGGVRERVYASTTDTFDEAADIDYVAIEHTLNGEPVTLTTAEKVFAARLLDGRGASVHRIAATVGVDRDTVTGWRDNGWAPKAPANAKLNPVLVREIRARAAAGEHHRLIAADYGVARVTVTRVVNRRDWAHVVDTANENRSAA